MSFLSHIAYFIRWGSALPATCSVGQVFILTSGSTGLYVCLSANTWTRIIPGIAAITASGNNVTVQSVGTVLIGDAEQLGQATSIRIIDSTENIRLRADFVELTGVIISDGQSAPPVSDAGTGRIYFDSTNLKYKVSENGGAYQNLARPYKVYTALLTQSGTEAPTAIIKENTLDGVPAFARSNAGIYTITLAGAFLANRVWMPNVLGMGFGAVLFTRINDNVINIETPDGDGMLSNTSIEIRIYPS